MTRSRLVLVLLGIAAVAGCQHSVAVPNPASTPLPSQAPARFTAHKLPAVESADPSIPSVALSARHAKWCVSKVGDTFPAIELPRLGGKQTKLASLYGSRATVVFFWQDDRWMSRMALEDLARDVAAVSSPQELAVVGIFVGPSTSYAQKAIGEVTASFPQLVDANGNTFAEVGSVALPRVYVLDRAGKIVWFDIEYSEGTRRELAQTLSVLAATGE